MVHHAQHAMGHARREATNEYAALFVALIGRGHPYPLHLSAVWTSPGCTASLCLQLCRVLSISWNR